MFNMNELIRFRRLRFNLNTCGLQIVLLAILGCSTTQALDVDKFQNPAEEGADKFSPQELYLNKIKAEFDSVDIADPDYANKRYELYKKHFNEDIRLKGSTPFEALSYTSAVLRASAYRDRLLKEDPRLSGREIGKTNRSDTPTFGSNSRMPQPTVAPPAKSSAKPLADDLSTLPKQTETQHLSADEYLERIFNEFKTVDIGDPEYADKRYLLFKKMVTETIRLKGWRPYETLIHVRADTRAQAYADRCEAEMEKEKPGIFNTPGYGKPGGAEPAPPTMMPAVPVKDTSAATKPPKTEKDTTPKRLVPPMLNGWTSVMRNYVKMKDLTHAKSYAQKIVDKYPGTQEADEAKGVMQLKD